jgi:hypothetical protein
LKPEIKIEFYPQVLTWGLPRQKPRAIIKTLLTPGFNLGNS